MSGIGSVVGSHLEEAQGRKSVSFPRTPCRGALRDAPPATGLVLLSGISSNGTDFRTPCRGASRDAPPATQNNEFHFRTLLLVGAPHDAPTAPQKKSKYAELLVKTRHLLIVVHLLDRTEAHVRHTLDTR